MDGGFAIHFGYIAQNRVAWRSRCAEGITSFQKEFFGNPPHHPVIRVLRLSEVEVTCAYV
jgi:hypothetical protein